MIQINDDDLPITAAQKIITGVKPYEPTKHERSLYRIYTGREWPDNTVDMYSVDEIEEIAEYLLNYCRRNKEAEWGNNE